MLIGLLLVLFFMNELSAAATKFFYGCKATMQALSVWEKAREEGVPLTQLMAGERMIWRADVGSMYRILVPSQSALKGKDLVPLCGYVRRCNVQPVHNISGTTVWIVCKRSADVWHWSVPAAACSKPKTLAFGTVLQACRGETETDPIFLKAVLPDGGEGAVALEDVFCAEPFIKTAGISWLREVFCSHAKELCGTPYFKGGRSISILGDTFEKFRGVDPSGLLSLLMGSIGLEAPRAWEDQLRYSAHVNPQDMKQGDVFFLTPTDESMPHRMLIYLGICGDDGIEHVIEVSDTSIVAISTLEAQLGMPREDLSHGQLLFAGDATKECTVACGTFFTDVAKLQRMRASFLAVFDQRSACASPIKVK